MKYFGTLLLALLVLTSCQNKKQKKDATTPQHTEARTSEKVSLNPWRDDQLMDPAVLAQKIENNQLDSTLVLSIGFDNLIKGSIDVGPASEKEGLANLKELLQKTPKDQAIVIYCGCCPFPKCPNIRPAFKLLTAMGFTNAKLLNLPTSIKADWMDKGYPINQKK